MKVQARQRSLFDGVLLLLFGLIPLLWYRAPGLLISGDMLPPVTLENFLTRFFAWDERLGGGYESLLYFSALFFQFLQAILTTLLPTLEAAQKAEFVFWFLLPGVTIYYLLGVILQGEGRRWGRLAGVAFYMFNLYLEPVWQGMNMANLAAYAFIPLILGLSIEALEKKRSFWFCVFSIGLVTFFAAPIGSNPPVFLACLIPFFCFILFYFSSGSRWKSPEAWGRLVLFFFLVGLFSFLVNLFWIIPFVERVFLNVAGTSLEFSPGSALSWLKNLSKETSLLNVSRLQGAWVWYSENRGEPYIPYASVYHHNPFFILLSYLLPLFAAAGFYLNRRNLYANLFALFAILGIILGAGMHPPFDGLYRFLVENLPFFWIIRSPWYKFTLLTCLGYAVLFAFLGKAVSSKAQSFKARGKKVLAAAFYALAAGLIFFNLIYAFPVSLGKMFFTPKERSFMTHNFLDIPGYVEECAADLKKEKRDFRVLELTPSRMQEYSWGNFGFNHPLSSLSTIPVFYSSMERSPSLYPSDQIQKGIKKLIQEKDPGKFTRFLKYFNIEYLLFPTDLHWYAADQVEASAAIREFLDSCDDIVFVKNYGEWGLFRLTGKFPPAVYAARNVIYFPGRLDLLPYVPEPSSQGTFSFLTRLTPTEDPLFRERVSEVLLLNSDINRMYVRMLSGSRQLDAVPFRENRAGFEIGSAGKYQIWVQAKGEDLAESKNVLLDLNPVDLSAASKDMNRFLDWQPVFEGELLPGSHELYIHRPGHDSQIIKMAVVSKEAYSDWEKRFKASLDQLKLPVKNVLAFSPSDEEWIQKQSFYISSEGFYRINLRTEPVRSSEAMPVWPRDPGFYKNQELVDLKVSQGCQTLKDQKGLVLRFPEKLNRLKPVWISVPLPAAVSLNDFPGLNIKYDLFDPRQFKAVIRAGFDLNDDGVKDETFTLPAHPFIPLREQVLKSRPEWSDPKLTEIRIRFQATDKFNEKALLKKSSDFRLENIYMSRKRIPAGKLGFLVGIDGRNVSLSPGQPLKYRFGKGGHTASLNVSDISRPVSLEIGPETEKPVSQTKITFNKINPTRYRVRFLEPFKGCLVLNQSFHPRWICSASGSKKWNSRIANGWANGFMVEAAEGDEVEIRFEVQKKIRTGFILSLAVFIFLALGWFKTALLGRRMKSER